MAEGLNLSLARLPFVRLTVPAAVVGQALEEGRGVRLGQSAVLSTKVHAFNSQSPEHVQIMVNADAGQVFYHRQDSGAICHLDIFHQCGTVDHVLAARYVCQAVEFYHRLAGEQADVACRGLVSPDLIDIQTAAGGGRITGALTGGQKVSLRRVHENHVHLAIKLPYAHSVCLFYIVAAVETAILNAGLELRCNEQISCVDSTDSEADLSPYTDQTDSLLTGQASGEQQYKGSNASASMSSRMEAPSPDRDSAPLPSVGRKQENSFCTGQTLVSIKENPGDYAKPYDRGLKGAADATPQHSSFYAPGLSDSLKQAIAFVRNRQSTAKNSRITQHYQSSAGKLIAGDNHCCTAGLDVAATVTAAASRLITEGRESRLRIHPADLRFVTRRPRRTYDVCLLTDSSGSMAGPRLAAAKYLAEEIMRGGCSRVSLVTFQDNRAEVLKPFTVSRQAALSAFDTITPYGATPLALGIRRSLDYLREQQAEKPLLVLITDGIPSRKYEETANPLTEAMSAASEIKQSNYGFLCIGLDTDDGFLKKLTVAAGGVLYVFTEFEKQVMKSLYILK
ncbi:vWA domain-containing protein [Sporomusa sp.]|uniref:vWA domain-containing protein n=1 Tax=Sporomusa sp. TaxID=2078658 RepID=UPI002BBFFF95|nr:VWA domain-containing protein [Sporomusa sp.]HWR42894.1 VWA domain-containing protein [Sporomusa sp.]